MKINVKHYSNDPIT